MSVTWIENKCSQCVVECLSTMLTLQQSTDVAASSYNGAVM